MERERRLPKNQLFDLLIIGGGIHGAGIARDAAMRGFKVCLIEKGDFASGTSSKSSKLIHGGLRYLEHGDFKLVREALQERHHLLNIAPHLVHPLSFMLPIYQGDRRGPFWIKTGLTLYDTLAGKRNIHRHEAIAEKDFALQIPSLQEKGLKKIYHYYDAQMNDARLTLENILSAQEKGALPFNYVQATELLEKEGRIVGVRARDLLSSDEGPIEARWTVNATGPWCDQLLARRLKKSKPRLRLTKGIHLIVPRLAENHALLLTAQKDGRVFFCVPWGPYSLIGTTDTDFSGNPDEVHASLEDIQYLLDEIHRLFPKMSLTHHNVVSSFAGVRSLVREEGVSTAQISREYKIEETAPGLWSILGGKFTTYRSLSEAVINRLSKKLKLHEDEKCQTASIPLPGGEKTGTAEELSKEFHLSESTCVHLIQTYGGKARNVAQLAQEGGLSQPLCPHHPHLKAEIVYAFTHEMAQTLDDFFSRRTWVKHSPCHGLEGLEQASRVLTELSILSSEEVQEQKENYRENIRKDQAGFLSL
ncbi:MAG: glycerol-3-phosphate dehydrogenase [Chlamydiae bacterium]|nr:glycerol-3-phosphate dehydrogenase [Chlamydiota bacterium]MBI3265452.1 glycerol-3-phosphate dehydrogenase [Chlamydiota bacterium]